MAAGPLSERSVTERPAPPSAHARAAAMAQRLVRTARRVGLAAAQAGVVERAFLAAIDARAADIADAGHFAFLHPARNALIVMDDLGMADAALIAAATLLDGEHPARMLPTAAAAAVIGGDAARLLASVPQSAAHDADDTLLEALLACDDAARLLALVDRLDHVRHLHLDAGADRRRAHERTATVFLPIAERTNPLLARRFAWWLRTFGRRFL